MATDDGLQRSVIPYGSNTNTNINGGGVKSNGNDDYVEITLDVLDDSVVVHSVKPTAGGADHVEDPELTLLAKGLEKRSSFGSSVVRNNASARIRQVSEELKRLTSFSKRQPVSRLDRTKSAAAHTLKGLKFISNNNNNNNDGLAAWDALEKRFGELTKETNGLLPRSLFGECIGMNKDSKEFAGELFDSLSRRRNITGDSINKAQLKEFWYQIADQSFDSRLQTFLDMVDKDADGRITEDEVKEIISLSASANKLSNIQEKANEYAALIMEELDPDKLGYITIENFEMLLLKAPTHTVMGEESQYLSHLYDQKLELTRNENPIIRWYEDFNYFLQDKWQRCLVIVVWIGVMVGLFTWKYIEYKQRPVYHVLGPCVCIAKGAAETLKLNMAIILLPVCRNTITWLRNKTRLGVSVLFDDNINFHKVIAVAIAIGVGLHAISHLTCDFPRLIHATEEEYKPMQQFFGDQAENYWHFLKEVEGYTGIIMVVLMTIGFTLATPWLRRGSKLNLPSFLKRFTPFFKKKTTTTIPNLNKTTTSPFLKRFRPFLKRFTPGFNAFWYSHHLFVIVYAMLIVHGIKLYLTKEWYKKTTWMYLAFPVSLYACERLIRFFRSSVKKVTILKADVYPGNVLALHMSKPQGFEYKSGQYMFVKCAKVSPFEWHPFSITSAPGDDYLSVHIRDLGDWTGQMNKVFSKVLQQGNPYPNVSIDGPYGAPSQDYKQYDVVLLMGLGIGATPMISIVKDIVNNMKTKEEEESDLENGVTLQVDKSGPASANNFRTTKAYFYWVTKEQGSFDWFKGVMNEVAEIDKNGVIEMHTYCTSVYEEGDARSALITMLQSLNHAKNGVDIVSGTRVKTHFAKPIWGNVYKHIAVNHSGERIGVFYCGSQVAVKELKHLALNFSHKTSTMFEFHKENF